MKILIIAQEDPVCFSPMFRALIDEIHEEIELIALAGNRGAGGHPGSFFGRIGYIYLLYRMMEWKGFFKNLAVKMKYSLVNALGLTGTGFDHRTIKGAASKYSIPVCKVKVTLLSGLHLSALRADKSK